MKLNKLYFILILTITTQVNAQLGLLTWTPKALKEINAQAVTITLNTAKGNQSLLNYSNTNDVYVHIGVITNLSTSPSDWKYVQTTWGQTNTVWKANYIGNNKYTYTIPGNLRTYFGVTNSNEIIKKICILFRTGNGSIKQANIDGSDMYIPVFDSTVLNVFFTEPPSEPKYIPQIEPLNLTIGQNLTITACATSFCNLNLELNGANIGSNPSTDSLSISIPITQGCQNMIKAIGQLNVLTAKDSIAYFISSPSPIVSLPPNLKDGLNFNLADSSVTFVLRAPGKTNGILLGNFNNFSPTCNYQMNMTPDSMFLWYKLAHLNPNLEYQFQYLIDGQIRFADPYSEMILDPWNDGYISSSTYPNLPTYPSQTTGIVGVFKINKPAFIFQNINYNKPKKSNMIVYEILLRDFVSTHDWTTLKDTLPYLKKLGINTIELMPFNEFEGNESWGYNPMYYFAPDKYYGTAEALKSFVDAAHSMNIQVIMDVAFNHTTGLSPMAMLYWDKINNRPTTQNPWLNPIEKHPYNVFNDFNHESPLTKYHVHRFIKYWLTQYDIDGFRWDLSKGFTQVNSGTNVSAWGNYDSSRISIWKNYYDTMQAVKPGSICILEHFGGDQEEAELTNYGMMVWGNLNYASAQNTMGYASNSDLNYLYALNRPNFTKLSSIGYAESHDEERIMYKNLNFGSALGTYNTKNLNTALTRTESMNAILLLVPGPKMIWQFGSDLGYDYSINTCKDGTVSNNCRLEPKPIKWNYLSEDKRKRLYETTASFLNIRHSYPNVFDSTSLNATYSKLGSGLYKQLVLSHSDLSLVLVTNFSLKDTTVNIDLPLNTTWYNYNDSTDVFTSNQKIKTISAGKYALYLTKSLTGGNISTSIQSFENIKLHAFPNPTNQFIFLLDSKFEHSEFSIYDIHGKKVHHGFVNQNTIDVSSMTNGMYILKICLENSIYMDKIIIVK